MDLGESAFILTKGVLDFEVEAETEFQLKCSEGRTCSCKGTIPLKVFNGLNVGEKVTMIMADGGDSYVVIDKY